MASLGGASSMSDLQSSSRRLILELREGLERLERFEAVSAQESRLASSPRVSVMPVDLTQNLRMRLTDLQRISVEMDRLWRSQVAKSQKDKWKRIVEQVAEETDFLKAAIEKYVGREHQRLREAQQRTELLNRSAEGARILRQHGDEYDEESQMRGHVHNSHQKLDEAFRTGTQVLQSYAEQRERLKSAQRKALDMLNTVGLSSSLLRMAERRQFWDRWLVYAGMVVTIVVVFGVWYLTH